RSDEAGSLSGHGRANTVQYCFCSVTEVPVQLKNLLKARASDVRVPLQAEDILFIPTSTKKIISGKRRKPSCRGDRSQHCRDQAVARQRRRFSLLICLPTSR